MHRETESSDMSGDQGPHFLDPAPVGDLPANSEIPAWEEVSAGRFMPRRVRGSFLGRTLG
ncbi:MAG: hypothetical protein FJ295_14230 [Planctomycetes bacterium]|nr:hypothetical protein [Planctomycetota bacterium]